MTTTTTEVARAAALPDAIRLDDVSLIGVFRGPDEWRALLRFPSGSIRSVNPGDQTSHGRVIAMSPTSVTLKGLFGEKVLTLPQ